MTFLPHVHLVILAVSVILALGGIMGFVKAKSKISLLYGLASAALLGVTAYLTTHAETTKIGVVCAILIMFVLDTMFTYRLGSTKKIMPNLVMVIILLPAIAYLAVTYFKELV